MTSHPARTPTTRRILDAIGAGNPSPPMSRITRKALLASGLIVHLEPKNYGLGIRIEQFAMPDAVYERWRAHHGESVAGNPAGAACAHCKNGWFHDQRFGEDVECVNGVLIDIDIATEGWHQDETYPAAPCVSKSGNWPKRDRGCQARLEEWAARGRECMSDEQKLKVRTMIEALMDSLPGLTDAQRADIAKRAFDLHDEGYQSALRDNGMAP
jgi:hypothetical protein